MLHSQRSYVVLCPSHQRSVATVLLFNLLLQSCQAQLDALKMHLATEVSLESGIQKQASSQILNVSTTPLLSASQYPPPPTSSITTIPSRPATIRIPQHTTARQPFGTTQVSSKIFATSSGEYVSFTHESGQWQAVLHSSSRAYAPQRTFSVVSPITIGPQLAWLQGQDIWTSKARIHIIPSSIPPYSSCVYLGKCGLFGGMFGGGGQKLPRRDGHARQASRRATGELVQVCPSLISLCLKSLLNACKDKDEDFRQDAGQALVEAAKMAPEQASDHLLTAYKDRHLGVRKTAIRALVEATKEAPEQVLDHLLTACKDASLHQAATRVLKHVAKEAPKPVLAPLRTACQEGEQFVRQTAIVTLGEVAKAAPELASACIETLRAAGMDKSDLVRDNAIKVLMDVTKMAPKQALAPLLAVDKDEDWYVRYSVIMALLEVVQAAPEHAPACLKPLQDACKDEDEGVRQAAIGALRETKVAIKRYERGLR